MTILGREFRSGTLLLVLSGSVVLALAVIAGQRLMSRQPAAAPAGSVAQPARPEAVAALGRLDPRGEIRSLAAPITGIGGSPRITRLLVQEGERVAPGQLLAVFDTADPLQAQRRLVEARIANLRSRVSVQERDIARYRSLSRSGAIPSGELDTRETNLLELKGQLQEALAERDRIDADLKLTELRAPIGGTVLRLHARVGERPTDDGVLDLGASDRMEALIEVYESDIDRVRVGQTVTLTSENGGFEGTLSGRVLRISPQVRQRDVLETDPTGDVDARIVEVRVELDPADAQRVRQRTGLKVIARFTP
ncbi:transporter, MFP family [Cyanobium sp. PCC 7001]|uniref:HlyD family efflux transporter periplasmic adaptor subunit n=1 Tax=Cyanobium sp. PCC 7001 TaxID=180281 RepID=UPI000180593A|nr:HlyD family efflux transporter periplasmic adaptor subunit [Cyanobium sp. PCC 7001]EDY39137.1 transporter, MFP family [Cyanobium sp. PCC 7001]